MTTMRVTAGTPAESGGTDQRLQNTGTATRVLDPAQGGSTEALQVAVPNRKRRYPSLPARPKSGWKEVLLDVVPRIQVPKTREWDSAAQVLPSGAVGYHKMRSGRRGDDGTTGRRSSGAQVFRAPSPRSTAKALTPSRAPALPFSPALSHWPTPNATARAPHAPHRRAWGPPSPSLSPSRLVLPPTPAGPSRDGGPTRPPWRAHPATPASPPRSTVDQRHQADAPFVERCVRVHPRRRDAEQHVRARRCWSRGRRRRCRGAAWRRDGDQARGGTEGGAAEGRR